VSAAMASPRPKRTEKDESSNGRPSDGPPASSSSTASSRVSIAVLTGSPAVQRCHPALPGWPERPGGGLIGAGAPCPRMSGNGRRYPNESGHEAHTRRSLSTGAGWPADCRRPADRADMTLPQNRADLVAIEAIKDRLVLLARTKAPVHSPQSLTPALPACVIS